MNIWKRPTTVEIINNFSISSLVDHLGIVFTEIGDNYIKATMPVDSRTIQPLGLLHGGASVVLAETLGSSAGSMCVNDGEYVVGLEINANHLKSARSGIVTGITSPIHLGKKTQVWEIKIFNVQEELVCISRLTLAVITAKS